MAKHKNIQLKLNTGKHDLERKVKQADKFLQRGIPVRITLFLFGRQKGRAETGVEFLENLHEEYLSNYKYSSKPTTKNLSLFYNPPRKQEE